MDFTKSVYRLDQLPIVKDWCKRVPANINALRIRNRFGDIKETLSIEETELKYPGCRVLNFYDDPPSTVRDLFLWI